ncbi:MAG: hypothetical protein AAGA39_03160 [Pseudomonadota bacterium]
MRRAVTEETSDKQPSDDEDDSATAVAHSPLVMGQTLFELSLRPGGEAHSQLLDIATVYRFHAPEPRPQFHSLVWRFSLVTTLRPPFGGLEESEFRWAARTLAQLLFDHHAAHGDQSAIADLSLVVARPR